MPPIKQIDTQVGFRTTTVRLTQAQFDEVDIFAKATGDSLTEFTRLALTDRCRKLAKDPAVQKSVKRNVARITKMLETAAAKYVSNGADDDEDVEELEDED